MYEKLKKIAGKLKNGEDLTLDFVGDSVTHGLNHCSSDETYTAVFASLMAEHFKEYSVFRYDGIPTGGLRQWDPLPDRFPFLSVTAEEEWILSEMVSAETRLPAPIIALPISRAQLPTAKYRILHL